MSSPAKSWNPDADTGAQLRLQVLKPEQQRVFERIRECLSGPALRHPAPEHQDGELLDQAATIIERLGACVPRREDTKLILDEATVIAERCRHEIARFSP